MSATKPDLTLRPGSASAEAGPVPPATPADGATRTPTEQQLAELRGNLAQRENDIERLRRFLPPIVADGILNDQERLRGERREVTVLFVDAVNFTRLSVSLDAESVFKLINDLLGRLVACVHRYGGLVDKFTGDGLMAVFGAPIAHENDAELAVRAAIDMQQTAAGFGEVARAQLGAPVQIRIGINRGPAIAGVLGTPEQSAYTVVGETVNVASRLETIAEPGKILVSDSVFVRTKAYFDFGPAQRVAVKGVDGAMRVYEAESDRAAPMADRGVPGMVAPYLGRDTQLSQLLMLSNAFLSDQRGRLVTVTGEAGLGKSRLVTEWIERIRGETANGQMGEPIVVWRGRGLPYAEGTGYGVFRSLLRDAIDSYSDPKQWQDRVSAPLQPMIRHLVGLPQSSEEQARWEQLGPERASQLTALAIREWLVNQAADRPLIVTLDDFHWADDLSRQVLQSLLGLIESSRVLFCVLMRPHPSAQLDCAHLDPTLCHHAVVQPLSAADSRTLLANFVDLDGFPASLIDMILERAEGNPFFIEEFVRMLIEQEVLQLRDGRWAATSGPDLDSLDLPTTLRGLMLARIDRLPENLRYLLQDAAVIGLQFDADVLQAVEQRLRRIDNIGPMLDRLCDSELLQRRSPAGKPVYAFRHVVTQETVYNSILRSERPELHQAVAEAIEGAHGEEIDQYVEALVLHYDRARIRPKALHYSLLAGQQAQARFANREAISHYSRALQLSQHLGQTDHARWSAAVGLGDVQQHVGEYEDAAAFYEAALSDLSFASPRARADVMMKLGRVWDKIGNLEQAESWLRAASDEILRADDRTAAAEADIYGALGWLMLKNGDLPTAQALLERALALVEMTDELAVLASVLNRLGAVYFSQGEWRRAAEVVQRSLDIREELGDLLGVARSSNNLGILLRDSGDWSGALQTYRRSLDAMQTIGDVEGVAIAHTNIGNVFIDTGEWDEAERSLQRSYDIAQRIANPYEKAQANMNLGRLFLRKGEHARAARYLNTALTLYAQVGASANPNVVDAYWLQGTLYLEQGQLPEALEWRDRSYRLLRESTGDSDGESPEWGRFHQLAGRLALVKGEVEEGLTHLARAKEIFLANNSHVEVGRTAYWLAQAQLRADNSVAALAELETARDIFQELGAVVDLARATQFLAGLEKATR